MRVELAIVVVHFRTLELTLQCLHHLWPELRREKEWRVVVVDNESADGSAEKIEEVIAAEGWQERIALVRAGQNGGFSAGNNVGLQRIEADYYVLLNSDAWPREGALRELIEAARAHPEAGLVSPRLLYPDGSLHHSCYRWHRPRSEFLDAARTGALSRLLRWDLLFPHTDEPVRPEWTSFACVLLTARALADVGLMDEGFFLYYEDQDYGRRVWQAGLEILHWPRAVVVHDAGRSGPVREDLAARRRPPAYLYAARSRYFAKYYGRVGLWATNVLWWCGRSISLVREWTGLKRSRHVCVAQWRDLWIGARSPLSPWRPAPQMREPANDS